MFELKTSPSEPKELLFEVEFGLSETTLINNQRNIPAGDISTFLGKKNKISVGKPQVMNIEKALKEKNIKTTAKIKQMLDKSDFYHIRFACTFKPDKECKFVWVRFGLKLYGINIEKKAKDNLPIAYDMFPKEVYEEIKVKRATNIGPNFKFKDFIQFGVGSKSEKEFIKYEPEIISFGLLEPDPCWDFRKSKGKDFIIGSKELFLIVKAPKGMNVEAKFEFAAEVHSFLGILPMIPLQIYKNDKVVEGKYLIC